MERKVNISDLVRDDSGLIEVTKITDDNTIVGIVLTKLPDDNLKILSERKVKINEIRGHTSPIKTTKDRRLKRYKNL